jgi:hypothetical protein
MRTWADLNTGQGGPEPPRPGAGDERPVWANHPKRLHFRGEIREFYGIGALAQALGRSSNSIRRWEAEGILPRAPWRSGSGDFRGRRRLFPQELIQEIVEIAQEEGVTGRKLPRSTDRFTGRVVEAYRRHLTVGSTS